MTDAPYEIQDLDDEQRRALIDSAQVYEAYVAARRQLRHSYGGTLRWKPVAGRDYLVKVDSTGRTKSFGRRCEETENIYRRFHDGRKRLRQRIGNLEARLGRQARMNRALGLGRVPKLVAKIARRLDEAGALGRNLVLTGTNAIYAYEAAAGVRIDPGALATGDLDLLWDARSKLRVDARRNLKDGVFGLLRKIDRSFQPTGPFPFRAINDDGFMVDLISPTRPLSGSGPDRVVATDSLVPVEIHGLAWLVNSRPFSRVVVAADGTPARLTVPDPRAFAVHKLWTSSRDDRDPVKKTRDHNQAYLVVALVERYLPQYTFNAADTSIFPRELRQSLDQIRQAVGGGGDEPAFDW